MQTCKYRPVKALYHWLLVASVWLMGYTSKKADNPLQCCGADFINYVRVIGIRMKDITIALRENNILIVWINFLIIRQGFKLNSNFMPREMVFILFIFGGPGWGNTLNVRFVDRSFNHPASAVGMVLNFSIRQNYSLSVQLIAKVGIFLLMQEFQIVQFLCW